MNRKLECEIIRDLLPTYVDGQTSDVTNTAIREHISECHECAEVLRRMEEPEENQNTLQHGLQRQSPLCSA